VDEMARRLGDVERVLPYTVVLGPEGQVLRQKVGIYTEAELEAILQRTAS
jgi:hypothetical protein